VTLFYGELDAATGSLTYVNAGHNPPFLLRADGAVERLEPTAMVLGVAADAAVEARQTRIGPADRLLLFTDGLSEAFDRKDEEYGEERVRDSLLRAHTLPPPAAVERLVADVERFCGSVPLRDDMTLMLVARQAAAAIP
jgi:sigma-B regulation protein RsbU (phosphoserine phosphatase)